MWGMWWQTIMNAALNWVSLQIYGRFFFNAMWIKCMILKDFWCLSTLYRDWQFNFFCELCCYSENVSKKGKARVRKGINTHQGQIQAWFVHKTISIIYLSSNIYLNKTEQSCSRGRRKWVTWHSLNQMYVVKRFTAKEKKTQSLILSSVRMKRTLEILIFEHSIMYHFHWYSAIKYPHSSSQICLSA